MKVPADWVHIGHVARPHGVRGALKLHLFHADSEVLRKGTELLLDDETFVVEKVLGDARVHLEGLADRNRAETLKGREVRVARAAFPEPADDEVYLVDLVNLPVADERGESLGVIAAFSDNGAQPIAHVHFEGREILVPLVRPILVDIHDDRVVLAPPIGLFDDDEAEEAR